MFAFLLPAIFLFPVEGGRVPCAYFPRDVGPQLTLIFAMALTMLVVWATLSCTRFVSVSMFFVIIKHREVRECSCMFMYVIACAFNVCFDSDVTFSFGWEIMKGFGFRTYHAQSFEDNAYYRPS